MAGSWELRPWPTLSNGPYRRGQEASDYLVPGLILFGSFGVGSLGVAGLVVARGSLAPILTAILGVGRMIWIVVEYLIIDFNELQVIFFSVGLAMAVVGLVWARRSAEGGFRR